MFTHRQNKYVFKVNDKLRLFIKLNNDTNQNNNYFKSD